MNTYPTKVSRSVRMGKITRQINKLLASHDEISGNGNYSAMLASQRLKANKIVEQVNALRLEYKRLKEENNAAVPIKVEAPVVGRKGAERDG